MKQFIIAAALVAPIVLAAPTKRQYNNIDTTILQFALTLEHLENKYYTDALQKFSAADFENAGYGADYYNDLKYIATDEQSHVQFLSSALEAAGQVPNAPCTYSFPYTDIQSFITLSSVLEGVGSSAYLGGAPLITDKGYLTAAGSILVTEALHTSLQRSAINEVPIANPYGTPLDPNSVYTLASAFIESCPASNVALPFTPFPSLTLDTKAGTCEQPDCSSNTFLKRNTDWEPVTKTWSTYSSPEPTTTSEPPTPTGSTKNQRGLAVGSSVSFTAATTISDGSYLTFVSGHEVVSLSATIDGTSINATIPSAAAGQAYVFVTNAVATYNKLDGNSILFGPAIVEVTPAAPTA